MPVDLVGALVGWVVSLVGDAGIRLVRRSPDERALSTAIGLAIDNVVEHIDPSSRNALRLGLRECFSTPPRMRLDVSTSVGEGLRDAIAAQVAQLDEMVHSDSGQPFYQMVPVRPLWLTEQITEAIRTSLRQVVAAGGLAELVHALDTADVLARLNMLGIEGSEVVSQALVESDDGSASDFAGRRSPIWVVPPLRGDEVARPGLMEDLVRAVIRPGASAVGMTIGLWGPGGFGKTTMARLLTHQAAVREQFPDGVAWVTVGHDAVGPELADKVTNLVGMLCGVRPPLTDPLAAGAELGRVLEERRVLLVLDDVWTSAQVEPFLIGGSATVRLVTTRVRGVVPPSAEQVQVDEMERGEAVQLLTAGVSEVSSEVMTGMLAVTGRWPVLLSLVNGAVLADLHADRRADESMREILHELRTTGPTALDITDDDERHTAVARTIEVSLGRLTADQTARYLELAVFGADVAIPYPVLARYWKATGGWSQLQTRRYCQRLAGLALVINYYPESEQVVLHDVIRAYLREQTRHRLIELNRALVDAHRSLVANKAEMSAWWQLPAEQTYLWACLPAHLRDAGLEQELRECLHHPGWLAGKLEYVGPAGLDADLALSDEPLSQALRTAVQQNAHVLRPLEPPGSLAATLASRLPSDGPTRAIAEQLVAGLTGPHLRAITPFPDLPHPALSRVLTGHTRGVRALVVAPDGSWLASASDDGQVRVWDPATGATHHILIGHTCARLTQTGHTGAFGRLLATTASAGVSALVAAPDGSWLASAGGDGEVRVWDPETGATHHILTGHTGGVSALVVAPDGSWLASAGDGEVLVWDPATRAVRHTLTVRTLTTGHAWGVSALVVAPDGSWLASAAADGKVRVWDTASGAVRHILIGHTVGVRALVVAPDGSRLASADTGGNIRIWDMDTGVTSHTLTDCPHEVTALVVAPDGSWLASVSGYMLADGGVRIWDPITGTVRHTLTGHTSGVRALVVAPDGSWLASADARGEVRIWDPDAGTVPRTLTGHIHGVSALMVAPDGSWLASVSGYRLADRDARIWIWDPDTGVVHRTLTGHTSRMRALAAAPDGSWLASASDDGQVRIWDLATGATRRVLTSHIGHTGAVEALAVAPDGSWLASAACGEVRIWDPVTGATHRTLTGHTGGVFALAVAPDGSWLASAGGYGQVRIWDPATGTARHTLTGHTRGVTKLAVAPDGSWLASAGTDGDVWVWDPATGTACHSLTGHTRWVSALVVAPDGSWLASAAGEEVRIWDPATASARHTLIGYTSRVVQALAVAPDGSWLASASDDGQVRIWDPVTGAPLTSLRVAGSLTELVVTPAAIAAGGEHGPYFLALCHGIHPTQDP